jgi:GcrA cell cycle regulator
MPDVHWSCDRVTTLSTLWLDGLSASQIAKQLGGVTRNAVIGKIHRLGLSGRAAPSRPSRAATARTPTAPRPIRAPTPPRPPRPSAGRPVTAVAAEEPGLVDCMTALGAHVCKWPIGDPKAEGFTFCGRHTQGVYCAPHAKLAHRPGKAGSIQRGPMVWRVLAGRGA